MHSHILLVVKHLQMLCVAIGELFSIMRQKLKASSAPLNKIEYKAMLLPESPFPFSVFVKHHASEYASGGNANSQ